MNELKVCIGTTCHLNGANNVVMTFQHLVEEHSLHDKLEISAIFCDKTCSQKGVAVHVNGKPYRISSAEARQFFLNTVIPELK